MNIFNMIGKEVTVTVDRPIGTYHSKHKDIFYKLNYGFIDGMIAPDGEFQDAYILGVEYPIKYFTGTVIAVIVRHNDVENKLVVSYETSFNEYDIRKATEFQEKYFDIEIIMKGNS